MDNVALFVLDNRGAELAGRLQALRTAQSTPILIVNLPESCLINRMITAGATLGMPLMIGAFRGVFAFASVDLFSDALAGGLGMPDDGGARKQHGNMSGRPSHIRLCIYFYECIF